jgi:hypothetical protein
MPLTIFLAFCILGCVSLLYVLFQWTYGENRRKHACPSAARRKGRHTLSTNKLEEPRVLSFPHRPAENRGKENLQRRSRARS